MKSIVASSRFTLAIAIVWAALVGVSVPLGTWNGTFLNRHATEPSLHGFYVAELAVVLGGVQLVPLSMTATPWERPKQWWAWLGGICSLMSFICVSATPLLGVQMVMVTQLVGVLGTFFVFDMVDGNVRRRDWHKFLGFATVVMGLLVDNFSAFTESEEINGNWIFHFVGVFLSGVGFAFQSKCNSALALAVGGPARAALISSIVNAVAAAPIFLYIWLGERVPLALDASAWPLWLAAGFQSAFCIGSMAKLPSLLGFTMSYMVVLGSKLLCSTSIDAAGLAGKLVPLTLDRVISMILVFLGATVFNACGKPSAPEKSAKPADEEKKKRVVDPQPLLADTDSTEAPSSDELSQEP